MYECSDAFFLVSTQVSRLLCTLYESTHTCLPCELLRASYWFSCDHYRGVKTSWKTALSARRALNTQLIPWTVRFSSSSSHLGSYRRRTSSLLVAIHKTDRCVYFRIKYKAIYLWIQEKRRNTLHYYFY